MGIIGVDEHRQRILAAVRPLPAEPLPIAAALGRTLRVDAAAPHDIPAFAGSAMDGFAVRFDDVRDASPSRPVRLRVVADLPAGTAADPALGPGEAARIMTGAAVPSDADAVVPFEDTAGGLSDSLTEAVVLAAPARRGRHIRTRAEDAAAGAVVVVAGTRLGSRQLAAIGAAGVAQVTVSRRPRVVVLSTGDELVSPGTAAARGRVHESNGLLVASLVAEADAEVVHVARVPDDPAALRRELDAAAGADAVITTGGISAGAYEVVKQAAAMEFVRVGMQPGKPQGFGAGSPLLFGLPGNPGGTAVSFEVFVRPALLAMQGRTSIDRRRTLLPVATGWTSRVGREEYRPVVVADDGVHPLPGDPIALGRAEAYAVIPARTGVVHPGDLVSVMLVS
ncbi:molybdopterin biosynthesis protein [Microbacterium mangrovi]|uniref:Molybdopterin molybdenumtransferase n=1 Tax=Microbacterium mangrovi TaxID=1348253 RepID=A0A0B2ABC9_9MICO|nr:gephyrin-like molybdotransferase Glp [Microbacterium mangrovi]KHK98931.1 molybdopterin biosynthesis protein [Microbacterium mangrovi]